ncbi:MAG: helix-turn-helix transcriptional regulator [Selenomonas sp.]|uniref:winged helix-turn-helix transcriptional regulator n=1 Tax=Selenomonas sp. TaxID=2053611 RepID=UPI0025D99B50|nr:helix-turn-helix domain-containing protein [Selenomonas sp.]MCR5756551.1 helix-turn-helix transcriptional regulator [Selenomonas sp.]
MTKEKEIATTICGLRKTLAILGGKWKILIICTIDEMGVMRYNELKKKVTGITNTMLAHSLHELEQDGMVIRRQYPEIPVRVEYELTERCRSIIPILLELKEWGEKNISE